MKWKEAKRIINKDPEVLKELKNLEPEYKIIGQLITLRKEKKITQRELAELIGDKQSNISRLESGNYNPTIAKLKKIADSLDYNLDIKFVSKAQ
jgi:transcriptional regulator with XRE-family HTH domain